MTEIDLSHAQFSDTSFERQFTANKSVFGHTILCVDLRGNQVFPPSPQMPTCGRNSFIFSLITLLFILLFLPGLPPFCKGSPVFPNLLINKLEQIKCQCPALLSQVFLTWLELSSRTRYRHMGHPTNVELKTNLLEKPASCLPSCGSTDQSFTTWKGVKESVNRRLEFKSRLSLVRFSKK